ncbi:LysR family transcriptional regulator [Sphingomonas sp. UYP23]
MPGNSAIQIRYVCKMRFKGLDLNLLAAFAVLIEERGVSRSAERLNLSQLAVSAALARLRIYFGDALLVAEGKRMFPTALAGALAPQVAAVLDGVWAIVDTAGTFDPARSPRIFRIAASDYIALVVFPRLVQRLEHIAPGGRIMLELPDERTRARLDEGRIDLFVRPHEFASPPHPIALLFTERHVVGGGARTIPRLPRGASAYPISWRSTMSRFCSGPMFRRCLRTVNSSRSARFGRSA